MRRAVSLLIVAATAVAAFATGADAQPRRARHRVVVVERVIAPPLTVRRRSFLDSGTVVPVGSRNNYVTTVGGPANNPMEEGFGRSKFGNEALPRRFDIPGRPENVFAF